MNMTHRERLRTVLEGGDLDQLPWVPRMKLWYEFHRRRGTLPDPYQDMELREIEEDLGMGAPAREGKVFDIRLAGDVEIEREEDGLSVLTEYSTPEGKLRMKAKSSEAEYGLETVEHLIKGEGDYSAAKYLIDHLQFVPTYEEYLKYEEEIGERGIPLVPVGLWPPGGSGEHCPMHRILRDFLGYEKGYLHLFHECPQKVRDLHHSFLEKAQEMWNVVLESPAELILHGSHFDAQVTPPSVFEEFFLPYFRDFAQRLHEKDKKLVCHLDAETDGLFELVEKAGFDMVDCFTTVPLVQRTTVEEARRQWGDRLTIWGGIPSTILEPNYKYDKFERYMRQLFRKIAPGDRFILGIADNLMPSSDFRRVIKISEMVEKWGQYPIQLD